LEVLPTVDDQEIPAHRSIGIYYWEDNVRVLDVMAKLSGAATSS
jgi:hypothetical protein